MVSESEFEEVVDRQGDRDGPNLLDLEKVALLFVLILLENEQDYGEGKREPFWKIVVNRIDNLL